MSTQAEENKASTDKLKKSLDEAVSELERIEKESGKTSDEYKTQAVDYTLSRNSNY